MSVSSRSASQGVRASARLWSWGTNRSTRSASKASSRSPASSLDHRPLSQEVRVGTRAMIRPGRACMASHMGAIGFPATTREELEALGVLAANLGEPHEAVAEGERYLYL